MSAAERERADSQPRGELEPGENVRSQPRICRSCGGVPCKFQHASADESSQGRKP